MHKCNFCTNEYGSKKSLVLHQKTAKFCLKIQKENENHTNVHTREILFFTFFIKNVKNCKNEEKTTKYLNFKSVHRIFF
jgi:hypothetical protein